MGVQLCSGIHDPIAASREEASDVGGIAMKRTALVSMVSCLLTAGVGSAMADDLRGDLQVMRPDGTVLRISSPSVDAWWDAYYRARCASCKEPRQAAQLMGEVETALGSRFSAGPRYLILPEALELGWPHAWLFYPSTDRTHAYVVRRGGVGSSKGGLRWDVWIPVTERMERLILEGADERSSESSRAVSNAAGSRFFRWVAVVAALAAASFWLLFRLMRRRAR
jgi:hypothetical protein